MMRSEFYEKYMRSEEWQAKRSQRILIDGDKCVMCQRPAERTKTGLQVHHINYRNLGNEDVWQDLVTLCPSCHRKIHRYYDRRRNEEDLTDAEF